MRALGVASHERQRGSVEPALPSQPRQLRTVLHDHPGCWCRAGDASGSCLCQKGLQVIEPAGDGLELVAGHQSSDKTHGEYRPGMDDVVGEGVHPTAQDGLLPKSKQVRDGDFHQGRGPALVASGEGVPHGGDGLVIVLVPAACSAVQFGQ